MTTTTAAPMSTGSEQGVRDFWAVYDSHVDELSDRLRVELADDPDLGPLMQAQDAEAAVAANRESRELTRAALLDGAWEPYDAQLRQQSAMYAKAGLPIAAVTRALTAIRRAMLPLEVAAYSQDPARLGAALGAQADFLDHAMAILNEEYLEVKEDLIRKQAESIREISSPVLRLRDRLLLMPIVGIIDTHRAAQLTEALLQAIHTDRAKAVVIDITGVPAVDSRVAQHLVQAVSAARLMGTRAVVTGLSPEVAQSMVTLGIDLGNLHTVGDLQGGVEAAERMLRDSDPSAEA